MNFAIRGSEQIFADLANGRAAGIELAIKP